MPRSFVRPPRRHRLGISLLLTAFIVLAACEADAPDVGPVPLLTGVDSCYAGGEGGVGALLQFDATYGTSFDGKPVMWPVGFTGWRVGDEVTVRSPDGRVMARTGRRYFISIAPVPYGEVQDRLDRLGAYPAAAGCPYPWDFVDCGAPPAGLFIDDSHASCRAPTS